MDLTPAQKQAIRYRGRNLQLIACAGSGKTEVVAMRVAHLLTKRGKDNLEPHNIVAFTFTEKAAAELKERIIRRTVQAAGGGIPGMADMYVGTIHGFCLDLLRDEFPEFFKYEVLDPIRQTLYINRNSKRTGLTTSKKLNGTPLKRWRRRDTDEYLRALSVLREEDVDKQKLEGCSVFEGLKKYRARIKQDAYFDFSALLEAAVYKLERDDALRADVAKRVKYVVVDEYQDVNPIQERLVRLLHDMGAGLCVVGDDDQTIYQWRGSDVGNILSFNERYPDVEQIRLEENFRSSKGVIEAARAFVEQVEPRLSKSMKFANAQAYEPGDVVALSFDSPEEEARYIVKTIKSLRGVAFDDGHGERGLSWSDMAILLRSVKNNGKVITDALKDANIPFVVKGLANLFQTDEACAARKLVHFIYGQPIRGDDRGDDAPDEQALRQSWEDACLGLDKRNLDRAMQYARKVHGRICTEDKRSPSIQSVFLKFLESAELREENVPDERGETVFFNLGRFSQAISDWESINPGSGTPGSFKGFAYFLHYQAEDSYSEGAEDSTHPVPDAVQVMTVHQAKGLEWPAVFLPALLKKRFPGINRKNDVWQLIPREAIENAERYDGSTQDERRLFYVAMTRSKKFLHMTWAPVPGKNNWYVKESKFWGDVRKSRFVTRDEPDYAGRNRSEPRPKTAVENLEVTVTDLKTLFECGYQFKMRVLYGFDSPAAQNRLLYGKLLHDVLAEIHRDAKNGRPIAELDVPDLVNRHLRAPYTSEQFRGQAEEVIKRYVRDNADNFKEVQHSEQPVEIDDLDDRFIVKGRIDVVRRADSEETTIVDTKATASEDKTQQDLLDMQLYMYAVGYEKFTGNPADFIEIYDLKEGKPRRSPVKNDYIVQYRERAQTNLLALYDRRLRHNPTVAKCKRCDFKSLCAKSLA